MTAISATPLPARDALDRLQGEAGVEFVNGRIVEKPASVESAEIEMTIGRLLGNEAAKTGEARVFGPSMGYRCFPEDPLKFRKPDVSVVRTERLAGVDPEDGFIPFPPDLAVEVVSPNDVAYDVADKVADYLGHGFPLVWVVHPNTRGVAVHRADGSGALLLHEQDEISGESALPGFKCKIGAFFGGGEVSAPVAPPAP